MSEPNIKPHQVTKPIQLLAAWLVGLLLINGSFLGAAKAIANPPWASSCLVVAAIINVYVFLYVFVRLQTKFRAELQEDTYYSKHLEKITGQRKELPLKDDYLLREFKNIQDANNNSFILINKNLEDISIALSRTDAPSLDVKALQDKISETKTSVSELESLKIRKATKIAINDLLISYHEIVRLLTLSGFNISETFGSTSEEKLQLKQLTISYTKLATKLSLSEIYKIIKPFGFNRIHYDPNFDLDDTDIYIGSYIDSFSIGKLSVAIDTRLDELLLDDEVSIEELNREIIMRRT